MTRQTWLLGIFSAALLMLPFSIVGPVPFWRTFFAWIAFVPLFYGCSRRRTCAAPRPCCGEPYRLSDGRAVVCRQLLLDLPDNALLWRTASAHLGGNPGRLQSGTGTLFCGFRSLLSATARFFAIPIYALMAAPFFWVAIELLSARLTKVPWDLLGYSQVNNLLLTNLAPFTGVYGLSFVLMAGNALIAGGLVASPTRRIALF